MARSTSDSGRSEFTKAASNILDELGVAAYGDAQFVKAHILPASRKHQQEWRQFILEEYRDTTWLSECLDVDGAEPSNDDAKLELAARRGMNGLPMSKECEVAFDQDIGDRARVLALLPLSPVGEATWRDLDDGRVQRTVDAVVVARNQSGAAVLQFLLPRPFPEAEVHYVGHVRIDRYRFGLFTVSSIVGTEDALRSFMAASDDNPDGGAPTSWWEMLLPIAMLTNAFTYMFSQSDNEEARWLTDMFLGVRGIEADLKKREFKERVDVLNLGGAMLLPELGSSEKRLIHVSFTASTGQDRKQHLCGHPLFLRLKALRVLGHPQVQQFKNARTEDPSDWEDASDYQALVTDTDTEGL
ncbi:unnamed protein product [Symbiodinium natans]|uniref:Uncharacterized protein n=1 Tax=Symbiodinium natans TaxID=878477 RepID=A0A812UL97_9DINO|nr:unnamed protein product [Symbiodinium natans]